MALDFPSDPDDGDEYDNFYWDDAAGIWKRQLSVTTLDSLNDVSAATPGDNDILVYDDATNTWVSEAQPEIPPPISVAFLLMGA
jgi:hypothetical protein